MPFFVTVKDAKTAKQVTDVFLGYNHNLKIKEGEFFDMKNLTSDDFPLLSTRKKRGVYASPTSPQGMVAKDALCYVDGQYFVIDSNRIDMGLSTDAEDCPKELISMGAYVIIMPDKKYINTADLTDFGNIEASTTTQTDVVFTLCDVDGNNYNGVLAGDTAPSDPENKSYWLDTSSNPNVLKVYSSNSSMWISIVSTYIKISAANIGKAFNQYDGVKISGIQSSKLVDIMGNQIIWAKGDDYIVVTGIMDETVTQTVEDGAITVQRRMPNMDFITEANNRLWGCRYGTSVDGQVVNEIYACKLGDFKNWSCFMGISTDSYVASCGTDGQFTGAITHLGYPLFFKEGCLHKVYGSQPSNFQIQSTVCRGVQKGCHKSLAIVNEILYYMGRNGVCAYDGSLPNEISDAFGGVNYSDAVAGAHWNKYYISMKDTTGEWHMFCYDASKGLWHHEDETQAEAFCSCRNEMYYIDHADKKIKTVYGSGTLLDEPVEWFAETGTVVALSNYAGYAEYVANRKFVGRLQIRMSMEIGAVCEAFIEYDSSGRWERLWTMHGKTLQTFSIPIRPHRCDHFRIRLEGEGSVKVYSITKSIENGSDEE